MFKRNKTTTKTTGKPAFKRDAEKSIATKFTNMCDDLRSHGVGSVRLAELQRVLKA